jgi:hypothetical protein
VDEGSHALVIKWVNMGSRPLARSFQMDAGVSGMASVTTLSGDPRLVNSIASPDAVKPVVSAFPVKGRAVSFTAASYSLSVIRLKLKN